VITNGKFSTRTPSVATPSLQSKDSQDVREPEQIKAEKQSTFEVNPSEFEDALFADDNTRDDIPPPGHPPSFRRPERRHGDRFEVPRDTRGNPIFGSYTTPSNPYGPGAPSNPIRNPPRASTINLTAPPSYQCRPLPLRSTTKPNIGDVAKSYHRRGSTYTGKSSVRESLTSHRRRFYNTCRLAGLNADQGRDALQYMFEPNSIAWYFYNKEILDQVQTLEEAFDKLFKWSNQDALISVRLQQWKDLKYSDFKNDWTKICTKTLLSCKICSQITTNTKDT